MGNVVFERHERVLLARLNRPEALNALSTGMMRELTAELGALDRDPSVGCFVITGGEAAFAAGADIKEMSEASYSDMSLRDHFADWEIFAKLRTPKLAAVAGYALGGGCELALMCDIIFASETARFGQPEIKLGVMPGMGGSQRLTKLIGKSKAMDLILTGRQMDANEAERCGLVSRIFPSSHLIAETMSVARAIAGHGRLAVTAAREVVAYALEVGLSDGLQFERRAFHALFATADQKEGMRAFLEKRAPRFVNR